MNELTAIFDLSAYVGKNFWNVANVCHHITQLQV